MELTLGDIARRALRRLGVVAEDETPTADQSAHAFEVLVDALDGLNVQGVAVDVIGLGSTDLSPLESKWNEALIAILAERLAPVYGLAPVSADDHVRRLQAHFLVVTPVTIDLPVMPSRRLWRGY